MYQKLITTLVLTSFFISSLGPIPKAAAQTLYELPPPGMMVNISAPYEPLELKGILVNMNDPLRFDFLVDKGNSGLHGQRLKDEIVRLTKYFLTCLTVPEDDLWVNLSPYEKDRIVPNSFGITVMGKDLLEQDYLLKQIMASLSYPENELGKTFWEKVYRKAFELYGTTNIPINTFNKVWIVPKSAEVYAHGNSGFVVNSQLDVMLEADYKAFVHHTQGSPQTAGAYSQVLKEVILPQLRQEVNEGKNFAVVRQVFDSMILATWYKRHLKDSLLGKMYVGKNKVNGVDIADRNAKNIIFQQYLKAYKKCVYNYIREDYDSITQQTIPRKYASGGIVFKGFGMLGEQKYKERANPRGMKIGSDLAMATIDLAAINRFGAMVRFPDPRSVINNTHPFGEAAAQASGMSLEFDQAMAVPKFFRSVILPIGLAVAGLTMTTQRASASSPNPANTEISINMDTRSAIQVIDKQIFSVEIDQNTLTGKLWPSEDLQNKHDGLKAEVKEAERLLAAGQTTLDENAVNSIRSKELSAEVDLINLRISGHQQRLDNLKAKLRTGGKLGSILPQDIGWEEHLIQGYTDQRKERTKQIDELSTVPPKIEAPKVEAPKIETPVSKAPIEVKAAPPVEKTNDKTPAEKISTQVVPDAVGSGLILPNLSLLPSTPAGTSSPFVFQIAPDNWLTSLNNVQTPSQEKPGLSFVFVQSDKTPQAIPWTDQKDKNSTGGDITQKSGFDNNPFAGGNPPDDDDIVADIQQFFAVNFLYNWPLMIGIVGVMGRATLLKVVKKKGARNASFSSNPVVTKKAADQNNQSWGFKVATNEGPALPDADELAWIQQQQAKQSAAVKVTNPVKQNTSVESGLRQMDVLGMATSTGLAAVLSGGDIKTMLTALISSFFLTRLIYVGQQLLFHENAGHLGAALVQDRRNYKNILTWRNITANNTFKNFLSTIIPFGKPTQFAGVDLPFTGKVRTVNQIAGFAISAALCGLSFWFAAKTGLWAPLYGSLSTASLFMLYNTWMTDIWKPSAQGRIFCGDSGFIWLPNKKNATTSVGQNNTATQLEGFFPEDFQEGQFNMRTYSSLRGDQGEGILTWAETPDGDIIPVIFKSLKSKRGKNVTRVAQLGFNGELRKLIAKDIRPLSGSVREIITHDRFLTQGTPSLAGLHAHLGPLERRRICYYVDGVYQKKMRTVVAVVILNGDNDYHKKYGKFMGTKRIKEFYARKLHMKKTVFIEPNPQNPKGYYDYLASGDTPGLAVELQWYDNQGDMWASSRNALEIFYHSDEESLEHNLSEEEIDIMGSFNMDIYEQGHEQILIRPGMKKKDKTLSDSWVTAQMAKQNPELNFQFQALEKFRADLKQRLLDEVAKAQRDENSSAQGRILNRLHQLHPREDFDKQLDRYVEITVERFFTADTMEAAKEIDELTGGTGTYGVRALNSKNPRRGVFWTRGQSIALGVNPEAGYIAYNSEHTSLMSKMGNAPPVKEILFLNSDGGGQLTETNQSSDGQELLIRAYSLDKKRYLTEDELKEWRMELDPENNEYYTPLVQRDPDNVANEDIAEIPRIIDRTSKMWNNPRSFARRTADAIFNKLASRFVERYIKDNSLYYKSMQGYLIYAIDEQARRCQGSRCEEEGKSKLANARLAAVLRVAQNDPRILSFLRSRLDQLVAFEADYVSRKIINGQSSEDDLFPQLKFIDTQLTELMDREIKILASKLVENNHDFLLNFENEQEQMSANQTQIEEAWETNDDVPAGVLKPRSQGKGIPKHESIGSGEADLFVAGMEDSLWIGSENLKTLLQIFFPKMIIESNSSNKALDLRPNDRHKVGRRTVALLVTKSGATSPTKNLRPVLGEITPGNIFVMTGRVDTLIGLSLGQRYYIGAPFSCRILPTGNYYPSEVNSASEAEMLDNDIELVPYIVERFLKAFPRQRPWGMNVTEQNIEKLREWRAGLLQKAKRMTGVDEEGNKVEYPLNQDIRKNGKLFGKMIAETPLSNLGYRAYVFGIIFAGTPIGALAALLERETGLTFHSSGLGHLTWAALDTTLACSMPWWITTGFYRTFSGRLQRWARLGPPKVTIGDLPVLHQVIEINASKRGSMAISSMDADYHGGNPQDHYGPRFTHRIRRGSIEMFGLPEEQHALNDVLMTDSQSTIRTDMTIGNRVWDYIGKRFKAGPEIFTFGHGDVDPNLSQHHMNIGSLETVYVNKDGVRVRRSDVTDTLSQFYANSFDVMDRLIAYNVFLNEAYEWATKWGPWRVWRAWESYSKTGILSTPSPKNGPKSRLPEFYDAKEAYSSETNPLTVKISLVEPKSTSPVRGPDPAQLALKKEGGIDMNSRMMQLKVTGDSDNTILAQDHAMSVVAIGGVVPSVSEIVTVTPEMLKIMLGSGYMN